MRNLYHNARRLALKSSHTSCVWCLAHWPRATSWVLDRVLGRATHVWALGHGDQDTEDGWWLGDYWIKEPE